MESVVMNGRPQRTPRCIIISLGCPKNLVDSETLVGALWQAGYQITNDASQADVIIVNTCGFIRAAVDESLTTLRQLSRYKHRGRCQLLIAVGCLCSRDDALIRSAVPEVDACVDVDDLNRIPQLLHQMLRTQGKSFYLSHRHRNHRTAEYAHQMRIISTPPWYAYLKIAEGCDRACSFCVIPQIRGRQRSRIIEDIVQEASELVHAGVREIILIAQDTTRYGTDLYGRLALPELLHALANIDELHWVRLLYGYPNTVTDELIDAMASIPQVVPYIDIPLQHVHPDILQAMNRPGDAESYYELIQRLRDAIPDIAIRTTFIVGFPGETDSHFQMLLDFVIATRLDRVGVFTFSPEPGTPAADFDNQVPEEVKQARYEQLMQVQQRISLERNQTWIGQTLEAVIERWDETLQCWVGRTVHDAPEIDGVVYIKASNLCPGMFTQVVITDAEIYDLYGEPASTAITIAHQRGGVRCGDKRRYAASLRRYIHSAPCAGGIVTSG